MASEEPTPAATKPRRRRKPTRKRGKDRLERAATFVGLLTGVVGLVAPVVDLPGKLDNAFGGSDETTAELERQQKRAELAAAGPRLDVRYLLLAENLMGFSDVLKPPKSKEAVTLVSYPSIQNEILEQEAMDAASCKLGRHEDRSVAFLVIENRGRRDATGVTLDATRLRLRKPVRVDERVRGADYVAKLHAAGQAAGPVTMTVPRALGPGDGVRIPLWKLATPYTRSNPWCVTSRSVLEPLTVHFEDPVLRTASTIKVRRLASPEVYASGVVGRG